MKNNSNGGNFVWGVSTSAYQIEGAAGEDGRTPSIWDAFCREPGRILGRASGEVACDHYHRLEEDLDLLSGLGVQAYRFSVSWSRFLQAGVKRNPRGIDFYHRLVDGLLERGIRPFLTLYHWDLPQEFEQRGGWLNDETARRFADYAAEVACELGDRIATIATINEPLVVMLCGYALGDHAPGRRSWTEACAAAHGMLRAHGLAVEAIRQERPALPVGIVLNMNECVPASDRPEDEAAALRFHAFQNELFAHPLFLGRHSEQLSPFMRERLAFLSPTDARLIAQPLDFLGINYYMRLRLEHDPEDPQGARIAAPPILPVTETGWEICPEGLRRILGWVNRTYRPGAVYVTENGAAFDDHWDGSSPTVSDPRRVEYLVRHVEEAWKARQCDGVPLGGYFAWSMLDNFEWADGFSKRYGLVYIDFPTQRRVPKTSYYLWRELARGRRKPWQAVKKEAKTPPPAFCS